MSLAGDRIKQCRLKLHLTQDDVARHLGIGKQAVYKYETGAVTNIPLENLEKMANLFGTEPEYLAGWTGNEKPQMDLQLFAEPSFTPVEQHLVDLYRGADDRARKDAVRILEENQQKDTDQSAI